MDLHKNRSSDCRGQRKFGMASERKEIFSNIQEVNVAIACEVSCAWGVSDGKLIRQTSPFCGRARVHKIKSHELQFAFGISWNTHELFMFMGGIAECLSGH